MTELDVKLVRSLSTSTEATDPENAHLPVHIQIGSWTAGRGSREGLRSMKRGAVFDAAGRVIRGTRAEVVIYGDGGSARIYEDGRLVCSIPRSDAKPTAAEMLIKRVADKWTKGLADARAKSRLVRISNCYAQLVTTDSSEFRGEDGRALTELAYLEKQLDYAQKRVDLYKEGMRARAEEIIDAYNQTPEESESKAMAEIERRDESEAHDRAAREMLPYTPAEWARFQRMIGAAAELEEQLTPDELNELERETRREVPSGKDNP